AGIGPRAGRAEIAHLLRKSGASGLLTRAQHREIDTRALVAELRAEGLALRHHLVLDGPLGPEAELEVDGAATRLGSGRAARAALPGRALGPDDLWLLNLASGTTGLPKCVRHHQRR